MSKIEKADAALVRLAKKGDADAFGRLYESVAADSYRFALYYLRSESAAEDAAMNTAMRAFRSIKRLRNEESFRSWYLKILANVCMTELADIKKRRSLNTDDVCLPDETNYFPDMTVDEILASLTDTDRQIVIMSVLGGMNSTEIGTVTGMNPGTVRSRLSRALSTLREKLS